MHICVLGGYLWVGRENREGVGAVHVGRAPVHGARKVRRIVPRKVPGADCCWSFSSTGSGYGVYVSSMSFFMGCFWRRNRYQLLLSFFWTIVAIPLLEMLLLRLVSSFDYFLTFFFSTLGALPLLLPGGGGGGGGQWYLQASIVPSPVLEHINFVDTPGILAAEKHGTPRGYPYPEVRILNTRIRRAQQPDDKGAPPSSRLFWGGGGEGAEQHTAPHQGAIPPTTSSAAYQAYSPYIGCTPYPDVFFH